MRGRKSRDFSISCICRPPSWASPSLYASKKDRVQTSPADGPHNDVAHLLTTMKASGDASVMANGRSLREHFEQEEGEDERKESIKVLDGKMELDRASDLTFQATRTVNVSASSQLSDNNDTILQMGSKESKQEGYTQARPSVPSRFPGISAHGQMDLIKHVEKVTLVAKYFGADVQSVEPSFPIPMTPSSIPYRHPMHPGSLNSPVGSDALALSNDEDENVTIAQLPSSFQVMPTKSVDPKPSGSRYYGPTVEIPLMPLDRIRDYYHPSRSQVPTLISRRALVNQSAPVLPSSSRRSSMIRRPVRQARRKITTWRVESSPLVEEVSDESGEEYGTGDEEQVDEDDELEEDAESDVVMLRRSSGREKLEQKRSIKALKRSVRFDRPSFLCVGPKEPGCFRD